MTATSGSTRRRGPGSASRALPAPANHLAGIAHGGRVYYLGGLVGFPFVPTGAVWIYDPATDRFSAGATMPAGRERGAAGVALHDGRIYVAGGQRGGAATNQLDVYDPVADTWTALPDMPRVREHNSAVVAGGRLYVVSGRSGGPIRETDAYDFAAGRWVTGLAPIPTPSTSSSPRSERGGERDPVSRCARWRRV